MRSAFSKQHFVVTDLTTGVQLPDVTSVGNLGMGHETEKVRTATTTAAASAAPGFRSPSTEGVTGLGRYVNISGNSEPDDPYIEFLHGDLSGAIFQEYAGWERVCRENRAEGSSRDFDITWYRNEDLTDPVSQTVIFNARCKKFGPQGDASANSGGEKSSAYRLELECENIFHNSFVG